MVPSAGTGRPCVEVRTQTGSTVPAGGAVLIWLASVGALNVPLDVLKYGVADTDMT